MELHEELRKAREAAGLTQSELAKRAEIPRNQIVRAEKGENITLDTLRRIVVHLPAVTQLTLLEGVHLIPVSYPHQERALSSAVDALHLLGGAFLGALQTAIHSWEAVDQARRVNVPELAELGGDVDPRLLFKRLENAVRKLETFPKEVPKTA
ncbi:MAG TPA: helix-turn-helix transcriptional regulator [Thermoanaerobaculia bacterium]|nr:helix-turn-helix transcriptional regulator [Thermoanaerobaculia bacterium]